MITVKKTGFWIFGETQVRTDDGRVHSFAKDAAVKVTDRGVCVTEQHLLSARQTCFIDTPKSQKDGVIAPNAKSVAVTTADGRTSTYQSTGIAPTRVEQRGDRVQVVEQGLTGSRVVATHAASSVKRVEGSNCAVCDSLNPLYGRQDTPHASRKA